MKVDTLERSTMTTLGRRSFWRFLDLCLWKIAIPENGVNAFALSSLPIDAPDEISVTRII